MALTYNETTDKFTDSFTLNKSSGTVLSLATNDTYVKGDIEFTIGAKTASPTFSSPTPTGGSTASGGSITLSTNSNSSQGITVQTKYSINKTDFTYNAAVDGWVTKSSGAAAGSTTKRDSTNGTLYYVTALTVPANKSFPVTATGTVNVSASSNSAGTINVIAYPDSGSTAEQSQTIVSGGKWATPNVNSSGIYYGKVSVGAASATLGGSTTTTGVIKAAITNANSIATISSASGTAGTDYWPIKATASVTTTPKFTPSLTLSAAGWLASAPTGSATNVTVNGDSTGTTIYIPRATFTTNSANVVKYTTDGTAAGVNIASIVGDASTSEPTSGVYVAFTGSGNSKVATAGYIPKDATTSSTSATRYFPITQAEVTQGNANITSLTYTYDTTNKNFKVTGSATTGALTVNTDGYISSSHGVKNAGTASLSNVTVAKIAGSASISATSRKPSITKRDVPSGVTQAASGAATTTAPTSGVYVAVKSDANTTSVTPTVSITTNGYGTSTYHGIAASGAQVGAAASDTTYVPITTSSVAVTGGALNNKGSSATFTNATTSNSNTSGIAIQTKGTAGRAKITYSQATNGWVTAAEGGDVSGGGAVSASTWNGTAYYLTGVTLAKPASSGSTNTFLLTLPNGSDTMTLTITADNSGNVTIT